MILQFAKQLMIVAGYWKISFSDNSTINKLYLFYSKFLWWYYYIFITSLFVKMVQIFISRTENDHMYESLSLLIMWVTILVKIKICRTDRVTELVQYILKEEKLWENSKDAKISTLRKKQEKYVQTASRILVVATFLVWGSIITVTLYLRHEIENINVSSNSTIEKPFMYQSWLPFNANNHPFITLGIHIFACSLVCINNTFSQVFFIAMMVFITSQLKILQLKLRNYDPTMSFSNVQERDETVIATIKDCIVKHQDIIRFTEELNQAMKYLMLLEYMLNSLMVASVSVQILAMLENPTNMIFPLCYLTLIILQVFLLATNADEIRYQSLAIADACYESPWFEQHQNAKVLLHIMIMRAQKPLSLTIGPFDAMTTEKSLKIMKAAYSYVTIMMRST